MPEPDRSSSPLEDAESWFARHGLPYFVDDVRAVVRARLSRERVIAVLAVAVAAGAVVGTALGLLTDASLGISTGASVVGIVVVLYGLRALKASLIAGWALRRGLASLGLLLPLATRALPMLLLFITFFFINTEVWQVASSLEGGVLLGAVLFFAAAALLFLVPQMRQEVDAFDDGVDAADVLAATAGTPLAPAAREIVERDRTGQHDLDLPAQAQVTGLQMANLVLALVVAQAVQVLLLSLAVFVFFVVFGAVTIDDDVIETWLGHPPDHVLGLGLVSVELIHVSVFLAAFSGLYFTVVAITDEVYRREFFGQVLGELARAVGTRVVYRELRRRQLAEAAEAP